MELFISIAGGLAILFVVIVAGIILYRLLFRRKSP